MWFPVIDVHNMLLVLLLERHNTSIELSDCAAAEVGLANLLVVMVTVVIVPTGCFSCWYCRV